MEFERRKIFAGWFEHVAFLFFGSLVVAQFMSSVFDVKRFTLGLILSILFYLSGVWLLKGR